MIINMAQMTTPRDNHTSQVHQFGIRYSPSTSRPEFFNQRRVNQLEDHAGRDSVLLNLKHENNRLRQEIEDIKHIFCSLLSQEEAESMKQLDTWRVIQLVLGMIREKGEENQLLKQQIDSIKSTQLENQISLNLSKSMETPNIRTPVNTKKITFAPSSFSPQVNQSPKQQQEPEQSRMFSEKADSCKSHKDFKPGDLFELGKVTETLNNITADSPERRKATYPSRKSNFKNKNYEKRSSIDHVMQEKIRSEVPFFGMGGTPLQSHEVSDQQDSQRQTSNGSSLFANFSYKKVCSMTETVQQVVKVRRQESKAEDVILESKHLV